MKKSRIRYGNPKANLLDGPATHVRVYKEDHGDEWPWCVDAVDDTGNYSEELERFKTWEQAILLAPYFYERYVPKPHLSESGDLTWKL